MVVTPDPAILREPAAATTASAVAEDLRRAVHRFDLHVERRFVRLRRSRPAARIAYTLSAMGDDGRIWILASVFEGVRRRQGPSAVLRPLAWLAGGSAVVNLGLKRLARRSRPPTPAEHTFRFRVPADTSFPSGHAASGALMAVILSESSPMAPVWVLLALGIGASRVHVGVHHASDVIAGWLVGAAIGVLARRTEHEGTAAPEGH